MSTYETGVVNTVLQQRARVEAFALFQTLRELVCNLPLEEKLRISGLSFAALRVWLTEGAPRVAPPEVPSNVIEIKARYEGSFPKRDLIDVGAVYDTEKKP